MEKIAIAVLVKNEADRLEQLFDSLRDADVDCLHLFNDNSTDMTFRVFDKYARGNYLMTAKTVPFYSDSFEQKKNWIHEQLKNYHWILHVDADERFDPYFLENIRDIIKNSDPTMSFAFPRLNLPGRKDYPDYQVRLIKNDGKLVWKGETHETLYPVNRSDSVISFIGGSDEPYDHHGTNYCIKLDQYKIIHLARNRKHERKWW